MRGPQGILFDLGGTLLGEFRFDRAAGRAHLLEIAQNPRGVTFGDYAAFAKEFNETVWAGRDESLVEFPVAKFWKLADEQLGISFDLPEHEVELEFWRTAVTMKPEPGVVETLDALCEAGMPMGVVSNSAFCGYVLSKELEEHGLRDYFAFVMSSADYGIRKPHHMIFDTAAGKLGLRPADIWFAGDRPDHDVAGAKGAGMHAVWYSPAGEPCDGAVPDAEIGHWRELLSLMGV